MKRYAWLLSAAALLLAACEQAPKPVPLTPIDFTHKTPISLAVSEIRVVENYRAPLQSPNVEHLFPTPPSEAVKMWSNQRLRAAGASGLLEITLEDASVIEQPLPKTDGVRGFFTDDQSDRYDARIKATIRLYTGERAIANAEGSINLVRSRSINEKASVADRERFYHQMVLDMMQQFDAEAETRFRQYFSPYIR